MCTEALQEMSLLRLLWLSELQLCYQMEQFMCHLQLVAGVGRRFAESEASDVELNAGTHSLSLSFSLAFQTPFTFHRSLSNIIPFNTIRVRSKFSSSLRGEYFSCGYFVIIPYMMRELEQHKTSWNVIWTCKLHPEGQRRSSENTKHHHTSCFWLDTTTSIIFTIIFLIPKATV